MASVFSPRDLRFALAEASEGRITMAVEKILLFCYHYDPERECLRAVCDPNLMRGGRRADGSDSRVFRVADVPRGA